MSRVRQNVDTSVVVLSDTPGRAWTPGIATGALLEEAWTRRRRMTVYDGAYAGLARALERPLVTADRRLTRACVAAGIEAFSLEQPELAAVLDAIEG